jgi:hypothetical protein
MIKFILFHDYWCKSYRPWYDKWTPPTVVEKFSYSEENEYISESQYIIFYHPLPCLDEFCQNLEGV